MTTPLSLPALQQTLLDPSTLQTLFRDLAACAEIQSVTTRAPGPPRAVPPLVIDLDLARNGLLTGETRSVQIRYRHAGQTWCDTLMSSPAGTRLVRICEEDIAASVSD
jgi:hypothetical protein